MCHGVLIPSKGVSLYRQENVAQTKWRGFAKAVHEVEAAQDDARLDTGLKRIVPFDMEYPLPDAVFPKSRCETQKYTDRNRTDGVPT